MSIGEMLGQSAVLTLLGMCVVFSFLIILIGCMNLLRKFIEAKGWNKDEPKAENVVAASPASAAVSASVDTNAIVAAIATALHEKENQ